MTRLDPLGPDLILDELFDLTLYRELHRASTGELRELLAELIPVEERHFAFWKKFFGVDAIKLGPGRRLRLLLMTALCRLFGPPAVQLLLETIEVHGVRKYLAVWREHRDDAVGAAVRDVLMDEFKHEDALVSRLSTRRINPEGIRNFFIGFNDGLVENLGALSGFFAAFRHSGLVLMAGVSVAAAGALSMAAGVFLASSSEREMQEAARGKAEFLGEAAAAGPAPSNPLMAAMIVGSSYLLGALTPVLPVVLGARTMLVPALAAGSMIALVSTILAFLSGMAVRKRVLLNFAIMAAAVGITYLIGITAKSVWGIDL